MPSATALRSAPGPLGLRPERLASRGDLLAGMGAPQAELVHDLGRRRRIDREPRPHRGARGVVDLIDQAGGQLDELPLFVGGMGAGLYIEVGQHAQQCRADIDALATGERHQPVETRKQWSCSHVRCTRLRKNPRASAYAGRFKSWLRKTTGEDAPRVLQVSDRTQRPPIRSRPGREIKMPLTTCCS